MPHVVDSEAGKNASFVIRDSKLPNRHHRSEATTVADCLNVDCYAFAVRTCVRVEIQGCHVMDQEFVSDRLCRTHEKIPIWAGSKTFGFGSGMRSLWLVHKWFMQPALPGNRPQLGDSETDASLQGKWLSSQYHANFGEKMARYDVPSNKTCYRYSYNKPVVRTEGRSKVRYQKTIR